LSGKLSLVSVGPGFVEHLTFKAREALLGCDAVVGYPFYMRFIEELIAGKEIFTTDLSFETQRVAKALELARQGREVCLISSGDIGVYAMATLAFEEMREDDQFALEVIPGVTAATACASIVGAPLSHDFATLSLSDLLCPFSVIEERARRLAQADLCVCLYNVQSQGRKEGVYKILEILLKYKSKETLCAVVRNAYRPEQESYSCTLEELTSRQFDMFTSIIIGNKGTTTKRGWIYTPRGYGLKNSAPSETTGSLPSGAIWLFSGTSDGNELANRLLAQGHKVILSVKSKQGKDAAEQACPGAVVIWGRLGKERRKQLLLGTGCRLIIDATHPYAVEISRQLMDIAAEEGLDYVRYERPAGEDVSAQISSATLCEAVEAACQKGERIFLATGTKDLPEVMSLPRVKGKEIFLRLTADEENFNMALECGIKRSNIFAMQGPFSHDLNVSLWKNWAVDCVVSKESGAAGGFPQKESAARVLGIPLIVVRRPQLTYPQVSSSLEELLEFVGQKKESYV
jgi:precorrin-3B C17-methyltransferase